MAKPKKQYFEKVEERLLQKFEKKKEKLEKELTEVSIIIEALKDQTTLGEFEDPKQ